MKYVAAADDDFGIRYSTCNEDNSVETGFLDLGPDATVVCITGSTSRVLNLLTGPQPPKRLIALDANIRQNYLLQLKIAAIRTLTHDEYLAFQGVTFISNRHELFSRLAPSLSDDCRSYWLRHRKRVERGILFQGRFERFCKLNGTILKLLFRKRLEKLRTCATLDAQRRWYHDVWNGPIWRFFLAVHSSDLMYKYVLDDPIFYENYLGKPVSRVDYMKNVTERLATRTFVRENPMLSMMLGGNYDYVSPEHLPPNLRKDNFERLKANVDCVEYANSWTDAFFNAQPENSVDSFSMADIGNCMRPDAYHALIEGIVRTGKSGARFVLRHSYGAQSITRDDLLRRTRCFEDLQDRAAEQELTQAYTFTLGEVVK